MPDGVWFAEAWRRCVHDPEFPKTSGGAAREGRGASSREMWTGASPRGSDLLNFALNRCCPRGE